MLINFEKGFIHFERVVVVIKRSKNKIIYNSGLLYLNHKSYKELRDQLSDEEDVEIVNVQVYDRVADNYPRDSARGKMWCPFCMKLEKWSNHKCPVCGMSDSEFWVKKFNHFRKEEVAL